MKNTNSKKLAKNFGLEDYVNYKIEKGSIYIIQEDTFGRKFWLHFGKKIAYKNLNEMYSDIASAIPDFLIK